MHIFSRQKGNYHHTVLACYVGYLTQALVINFSPLLFVTFMRQYTLSLSQVSTLIAVSFTTQLIVDFLASRYVEKIGYRTAVVGAHVFAVLGMVGLAILPEWLPSPMLGLVIATAMGSIGGGLIEVMISPLLEACPTDEKSGSMSLLHSFYSWGQAGTILLSTLFFAVVGIEHWRLLACLWRTCLPLCTDLSPPTVRGGADRYPQKGTPAVLAVLRAHDLRGGRRTGHEPMGLHLCRICAGY